jgi:hypothetical protein
MTIKEALLISDQLKSIRDNKERSRKEELLLNLCFYLEGYTDAIMNEEEN